VFVRNRTQVTGAAIDLLEGSSARIVNCLFTENVSNTGNDIVARRSGEPPFTNCGAITIFPQSRAQLERCTLTGNRNGVDDLGGESVYRDCLFHRNVLEGGLPGGKRFELDLPKGGTVSRCFINGTVLDPLGVISKGANVLDSTDPEFDRAWVPQSTRYQGAGYRPVAPRPAAEPGK
jgi:hypothetical protein